MKTIAILIISLCLSMILQAQITKTIEVTPGNLSTLLTDEEKSTITNLTLTGSVDARDFRTMRDSMPLLVALDIREVTINYYEGYGGTYLLGGINDLYISYPADEIPYASFLGKSGLQTIFFPQTCKSIGSAAFSRSGLSGELHLPSTISYIDDSAFSSCSNLTGDLIIPPKVTIIESGTFYNCSGFTSLTIPPSVRVIDNDPFRGCTGFQFIEVQSASPIPLDDQQDTFGNLNKTNCVLRVPYGTRELYASAPVWRDFANIVESEQGFLLSAASLLFDTQESTDNSTSIKANVDWSAVSDQQWLSVNPASGNSDQAIAISVEANPTIEARQGTITFSSQGFNPQLIHVIQGGLPETISITPGGLATAFTAEEKAVLSNLTLTGTMDARDFRTIRTQMPRLRVLDISGVTIVAYTDTTYGNHINHAANTIPFAIHEWSDEFQTDYSLSEHPSLSEVSLPASLTAIGYRAFYNCKNLTDVTMQSAVETIGEQAFSFCSLLTSINFSPTVNHIGDNAFWFCSSLTSLELPPALTTINSFAFSECTSLESVKIPESVTAINDYAFSRCFKLQTVEMSTYVTHIQSGAFSDCSSLTSITIPKSVVSIRSQAFIRCKNLQSIYAYPEQPVVIGDYDLSSVFDYVDKEQCILYVPYGSKALYANAYGWEDFQNIVEMAEFTLSPATVSLESDQQSVAVELTTAMEWTVSSNQPWLTVTPASGTGSKTFNLTAEANPLVDQRTARVLFTTGASNSPYITVTQKGIPVTIELTAGNLSAQFPNEEQRKVNSLTLRGTMDARDFKFIRDQLPLITTLDLSEVTISAYSGTEGTYHTQYYQEGFYDYPANEIPRQAFEGYTTNIRIDFPAALTSIGPRAFYGCSKLTEITIPSSVTFIGESAFASCYNMTSVELPSAITSIENSLFKWCSGLTSITIPSTVTSIGAFAFSSCLKLTYLEIPNSVTHIGRNAFEICYDLQTVILPAALDTINRETFNSSGIITLKIPASVQYIDAGVFTSSHGLKSLYAYPVNPPELSAELVFNVTDQSYCTLYVPYGSKEKYAAAEQWKGFFNIVEMTEFELSYTELTIGASPSDHSIDITTEAGWTAVSDKAWLTVSPAAGNSSQTVTISALENTATTDRKATITFAAANGYSQTLLVTQQARINSLPVANAGVDQSVEEGETVMLDGSASTDADNDPLIYEWTAPEGITLSSTSDARPTFTAPQVERDTIYTNKLVVKDGQGISQTDEVVITITNKTIELGVSTNTVNFENTESTAEITITGNAHWTANCDKDWLTITPSTGEGRMEITLMAQANETFAERISTVVVSAPEAENKTITITQKSRINSLPVANAGADQSVEEGETVQLDGSASTDADNDNLIYEWSAPVGITLSSASDARPSFTAPQVERDTTYTIKLVVKDGKGISQADEVMITITNRMIELGVSTNAVAFESTESSAKILITGNAHWTATSDMDWLTITPSSGEGQQEITLTAQANETFTERISIVNLTASEAETISITITQEAKINNLPVANAGADQWAEEGETVQLDGSASADADNDALVYQWSAPNGITLSSASDGKPSFTAPKVEKDTVITFVLMVSDGMGNSQADEVLITITNKKFELGVSTSVVTFESRESYAKIIVSGNAQWTATSDKDWLLIDPSSGDGDRMITITAQANDTHSERVAIITVAAPEVNAKTITVTQRTLYTGMEDMISQLEIKYYPNPFTHELTIEAANPTQDKVSAEIYNLAGQRVKTLATAQKEANISIVWNGANEQGQQVPEGVYILKVNEGAWQVVKRK